MATEIAVLTKKELEANPSIIGESLAQLAIDIEETKANLDTIRNRTAWQRLTNNNTRDLAEAMIKQNDTISAFIIIVQGIIFLSINNFVILGGVMDALLKAEKTNGIRDNKYIELAKDYFSEAIKVAQKAAANEKEIASIKTELTTYHKYHEELKEHFKEAVSMQEEEKLRQADLNELILDRLEKNDKLDEQQSNRIDDLEEKVASQEEEPEFYQKQVSQLELEINKMKTAFIIICPLVILSIIILFAMTLNLI